MQHGNDIGRRGPLRILLTTHTVRKEGRAQATRSLPHNIGRCKAIFRAAKLSQPRLGEVHSDRVCVLKTILSIRHTFSDNLHVFFLKMGPYPVTNKEYERFLAANSNAWKPEYWSDRQFNQPRQPVVGVSWLEAKAYASWAGLHLPSEAQWEYACRAGSKTRYCTGDSEGDLNRTGWYNKNSGDRLHPVGEKEPNAFGLYDMHGNVSEWVEDDNHKDYNNAPLDGSARIDNPRDTGRMLRGGAWDDTARDCRAASRVGGVSGFPNINSGFRVAGPPGRMHHARAPIA